MSRHYHQNPETGVHSVAGAPPFPYTDGDEAETRLLQFIRAANDRSTVSADLAASIVDWPALENKLEFTCSRLVFIWHS